MGHAQINVGYFGDVVISFYGIAGRGRMIPSTVIGFSGSQFYAEGDRGYLCGAPKTNYASPNFLFTQTEV